MKWQRLVPRLVSTNWEESSFLEVRDKFIVIRMGAHSIPNHLISRSDAHGSPAQRNARRIDGFCGVNPLKMEARMPGISHPNQVCLAGLLLDICGKLPQKL